LDKILECNIRNYSIYFKDDLLFSYFEYHGCDLKSDWKKMDSHAKTQEWWAVMQPMQEPLPRGKRVSGGQRWRKFFISIKALLNPKTYFPDTAWVRPCCKEPKMNANVTARRDFIKLALAASSLPFIPSVGFASAFA